jgi:hypothetical protein
MCWCVDVSMCWCVDMLMCWCVDVLMCGCVDVLICWCVDVLMCWCVDVLMCWCVDVLMCRSVDVLICCVLCSLFCWVCLCLWWSALFFSKEIFCSLVFPVEWFSSHRSPDVSQVIWSTIWLKWMTVSHDRMSSIHPMSRGHSLSTWHFWHGVTRSRRWLFPIG